jgi:8-amino-7-oxononanoate synthase
MPPTLIEPDGQHGSSRWHDAKMLDFTSALYLGIRHPSQSLAPWSQLTTGKPAVLGSPPGSRALASALAELQGCERATLLPSTLHLFFDLFEVLRSEGMRLYIDAGAYPMARWGAERAASRGTLLRQFPHYDPVSAQHMIERDRASGLRPIILADGFCPECGRAAPLPEYLRCVIRDRGYVVLDDTQALGIWGQAPDQHNPYGSGGGGSLRLHNICSPNVIIGSSLAKGFGVPIAALSGGAKLISQFVRRSETRVHASPPSIAVLRAAHHALMVNAARGDAIRRHLAQLVTCFRKQNRGAGLSGPHGIFPVQAVASDPHRDPVRLHRMLRAAGVLTLVVHKRTAPVEKLLFVFTALHRIEDVAQATNILAAALDGRFARRSLYFKRQEDSLSARQALATRARSH